MKRNMRRLFLPLILLLCIVQASAATPYTGYTYDSWGESVRTPNAYKVRSVLKGEDIGCGDLLEPADMMISGDRLYILDSGNSRVIECDSAYRMSKEIRFRDADGQEMNIEGAEGMYVKGERLLIADTKNARVLLARTDGTVEEIWGEPPSGVLPAGVIYEPRKLLLDDLGNLYVLSNGCYLGAIVFTADGEYAGYFGANTVQLSVSQSISRMWRALMTSTQKSYTADYVPIEYNSFDVDNRGFIYTCALSDPNLSESLSEVKKLNALGKNILLTGVDDFGQKNNYGDREQQWIAGVRTDSRLIDIDVGPHDFINVLDGERGRIFQYDRDSNLVTIFGGMGAQAGLFYKPAAIESAGDDVLVLDQGKNSLTVFMPNEYGGLVRRAIADQNSGQFDSALEKWQSALRYNANSELANAGVGRMLMQQEKYREAMTYLKQGQDRQGYSKAYRFYRAEMVAQFFPLLVAGVLLVLAYALARPRIKAAVYAKTGKGPKIKGLRISRVIAHPLDFYEDLFYTRSRSAMIGSWVMAGLLVLAAVVQRQATGFIFNTNKLADFNIFFILLQSFGMMLLLALANWMVSTLLWGEGTLRHIWQGNAYAFLPYIITVFTTVILSNILTSEEGAVNTLIIGIGMLYTLFLLYTSVREMHRYSGGKALLACILIVLVSLLILFLLVLVISLVQQFYSFILTIVNEIVFRI